MCLSFCYLNRIFVRESVIDLHPVKGNGWNFIFLISFKNYILHFFLDYQILCKEMVLILIFFPNVNVFFFSFGEILINKLHIHFFKHHRHFLTAKLLFLHLFLNLTSVENNCSQDQFCFLKDESTGVFCKFSEKGILRDSFHVFRVL